MGRAGQRLRGAGAIALLALSVWHFAASAWAAQARGVVDFPIFVERARRFLDTGVLYPDAADPAVYAPAAPVYKFPPLYAMLLLPVARGGPRPELNFAHWTLQIGLYAGAVALAVAALRGREPRRLVIAAALLALNFEPFFETLWRLQLEGPILLLLGGALFLHLRGRDGPAGAALGVAAALKLYPAFLLLYFLVRRRFAVVGWALLSSLLVLVAGLIVIGPAQNAAYFFHVLPALSRESPTLSPENLGLGRYLRELFGLGVDGAGLVARLIGLGLVGTTLLVVLRRPAESIRGRATAVEATLFVPLMLLLMPNSWVNYQLLLVLPLLALVAVGLEEGASPALWVLVALAALLALFYAPCAPPSEPWPCAGTPRLLGLGPLPRPWHDAMVRLRVLATAAVWLAGVLWLAAPRGVSREAARAGGTR